jgi:hypothetical protein
MSSLTIAAAVFVCTFGGAMVGIALHRRLPKHHIDRDTRDAVNLVMGLIATMSALVLGLLIASAQSSYNAQNQAVRSMAANIIALDRALDFYGPEAKPVRQLLAGEVAWMHDVIWGKDGLRPEFLDPRTMGRGARQFFNALVALAPATDAQKLARGQALEIAAAIEQTRLQMFEQVEGSIPRPFIGVLIFWLTMLFIGFGLFAQRHTTMLAALLIGALSVSTATFLVLDLNAPYSGLIRLSDRPIRTVITEIGKTP